MIRTTESSGFARGRRPWRAFETKTGSRTNSERSGTTQRSLRRDSHEVPEDVAHEDYALFRLGLGFGTDYEHYFPRETTDR